jgi:hypothetical protein
MPKTDLSLSSVHNTGNSLSFINLDYVGKRLYSEDRIQMQPAFIYAVLALAKLLRSSKLETGSAGLSHALEFVHQAHTAYKDAIDLRWLDATLAEAAFVSSLSDASDALRELMTFRFWPCSKSLLILNILPNGYEHLLSILISLSETYPSQLSTLMIVLPVAFRPVLCQSCLQTPQRVLRIMSVPVSLLVRWPRAIPTIITIPIRHLGILIGRLAR